jgi:hypothetical protein
MVQRTQSLMNWLKQPNFEDPDDNLVALYIQTIALAVITVATILGLVYTAVAQFNYVIFLVVNILVQITVIMLIRFKKLRRASFLFLVAAMVLLVMGVLSAGGIHASSVVLFPVILLFAGLLSDRKSYVIYVLICITSIGFIIYAENQKITPPYIPDPPELPLFISVSLIVISAAFKKPCWIGLGRQWWVVCQMTPSFTGIKRLLPYMAGKLER